MKKCMNKLIVRLSGLVCLMAVGALAQSQNPVILFQDGFENDTIGSAPANTDYGLGHWTLVSNNSTANTGVQAQTGDYNGAQSPGAAFDGSNYFMYDRWNGSTNTPSTSNYSGQNCWAGAILPIPFYAATTPFHFQCHLWTTLDGSANNQPQISIGTWPAPGTGNASWAPTAQNPRQHLIYTLLQIGGNSGTLTNNLAWYSGSGYTNTGLAVVGQTWTNNVWQLVQFDWNGTNMTGTFNGVTAPIGLYSQTNSIYIQNIIFRSGNTPTLFYLDDVQLTTTAPMIQTSLMSPTNGATVTSRQFTLSYTVANGVQSLNPGSVQVYLNGSLVTNTPTVSSAVTNDLTINTISCAAPTLPYGSTNRVAFVYADNSGNLYTNSWGFNMYSGDTVFADSFSTTAASTTPEHAAAFDGTKILQISRTASTYANYPQIDALADPNQVIGDSDTLTLTLSFGVWQNMADGNNSTLAVIPEYITTNSTGGFTNIMTGEINLMSGGLASVVDMTGTINQYLSGGSIVMNTNAWNTISIQYQNGSADWGVSINGAPYQYFYGTVATGQQGSQTQYGNVNGFRLATAGNPTWAYVDGITFSNTSTGTLLFQDSFENDTVGLAPGLSSPVDGSYVNVFRGNPTNQLTVTSGVNYTNETFLLNPQTGTYNSSATTAAIGIGTGYGGATKYLALSPGSAAYSQFTTPLPAGTIVHAQAYFNWLNGNVTWGFTQNGTSQFATVTLSPAVSIFDGTNTDNLGWSATSGTYQQCALDYVVGAGVITVSFNGSSNTVPIAASGTLAGLFFLADPATTGSANVGAISATADLGYLPATNPQLTAALSAAQGGGQGNQGSQTNQILLSWTNGAGYVLQSNTNLVNQSGWVNVSNGGSSPATLPVPTGSAGQSFYRLSKPY